MKSGEAPDPPSGRKHPNRLIFATPNGRTILFCTVCTKDRGDWLANADVTAALPDIWRIDARAWLVGRWLVMPDHVHFFCTPSIHCRHTVEEWCAFWKDKLAKRLGIGPGRWQRDVFHHRIRSVEQYLEKLDYVRQNPVRAGLVQNPDEWLWQGEVERITFD